MTHIFHQSFDEQSQQISDDYTNNIKILAGRGLSSRLIANQISGSNQGWTNKNRSRIGKVAFGQVIVKYPNYVMLSRVKKLIKGKISKKDIETEFAEVRTKSKLIISEIRLNGYSFLEIMQAIAPEKTQEWCINHMQSIKNIHSEKVNRIAYIYADRLITFIKYKRRKKERLNIIYTK